MCSSDLKKPKRIFVNSVSDLFHKDVPDKYIDRVFAVMAIAKQHTFQLLTKRPERMLEYLTRPYMPGAMCDVAIEEFKTPLHSTEIKEHSQGAYSVLKPIAWPLPNVWLGVSTENQKYADERIPLLLRTPAAVRFLSIEPQLGPIILHKYFAQCECGHGHGFTSCTNYGGTAKTCHRCDCQTLRPKLNWVICGGESGRGARPFEIAWARHLAKQCRDSGVAFFFKQTGENLLVPNDRITEWPKGGDDLRISDDGERFQGTLVQIKLPTKKGGNPAEWPADLQNCRAFPETAQ